MNSSSFSHALKAPHASPISISKFTQNLILNIRNKILIYSVLFLSPLFILISLYSDYRTNSLALDPVSSQALQGILLGDGISIDRANKSTLLLPRVVYSKISLENGNCVSYLQTEKEYWSNKISDPCHEYSGKIHYTLSKIINNVQGENLGTLEVGFSLPWSYLIFIPIFTLASALLIYSIVKRSARNGMTRIVAIIESLPLMIQRETKINLEISELEAAYTELTRLRALEIDQIKYASLHDIAQQVAHDIWSPLSALEMISSQLNELEEAKRILIRNSIGRIRDITNSLTQKNKKPELKVLPETTDEIQIPSSLYENTLLLPILDLMITEKRIENRDKINININFDQTAESYGLFAKIKVFEFKRVLSNLVNNAIEALPDSGGKIDLTLRGHSPDEIMITVLDSGKGIPSELISRLGVRGNTFNKRGGSGLGLAHAKDTLAELGGKILIESIEGVETKVNLILRRETPPSWFVPKLDLSQVTKVVVLDDDQSIHQIWKRRFEYLQITNVQIMHFSNPAGLRKYFAKNFTEFENAIFLVDYEFSNEAETGLELIENLGIESQSILVTSHYEERQIRENCKRMNIKLIPKSMSGFVPLVT